MSERRAAIEATWLKRDASRAVETNLPLVYMVIKKHCRSYLRDSKLDVGDLVSWGTLGLYAAVGRYDPRKGKFSGFAVPYILGYIKKGMRSLRREIWNTMDSNRWHASQGREEYHKITEVSLDGSSDGPFSPITLADDQCETEDEILDRLHIERLARRLCRCIPNQDRLIVYKMFYEDKDQQEIADELGCSRSMVSWYWARTKKTAHEMFDGKEI